MWCTPKFLFSIFEKCSGFFKIYCKFSWTFFSLSVLLLLCTFNCFVPFYRKVTSKKVYPSKIVNIHQTVKVTNLL